MSHLRIPKEWTIQRSTPFFTKENVPADLLSHHCTAKDVFGQLCVMEGTVTYYGFADAKATELEVKVIINAGEFATRPSEYWHLCGLFIEVIYACKLVESQKWKLTGLEP